MTLSGYMKEKYKSDGVKRVYLFQLIGLSVLSTGVQLLAGSQILSAVTGISFKTMTILLACIEMCIRDRPYTIKRGQKLEVGNCIALQAGDKNEVYDRITVLHAAEWALRGEINPWTPNWKRGDIR